MLLIWGGDIKLIHCGFLLFSCLALLAPSFMPAFAVDGASVCDALNTQWRDELLLKSDFLDKNGNKVNVKAWRGKIVILHFWAPWSTDCVSDIKTLNAMAKLFVEKEEDGFVILPILLTGASGNIDSARDGALEFYKMHKIDMLDFYFDLTNRYYMELQSNEPMALPFTIIVNQQGREVGRIGNEFFAKLAIDSRLIRELKGCCA
jgi:thiol-disulfide isomerase/thioredoxin